MSPSPLRLVLTAAIALFASVALASPPRLAVTPKVGSLGLGADLSIRATERFNVRVMGQQFDYEWDGRVDGVDYDASLDLQSFGTAVDFYPTRGRFRISAGLLANGNELNSVSRLDPTASYEIGTGSFTGAELGQIDGHVEFAAAAPFVTAGWGNPFADDGRISFSVDLGIAYQPIDSAQLRSSNPFADPLIDEQTEDEQRRFEEDASRLELYPALSFGICFRF